ncbi:MAG: adenosylmethionine decarboxylase [Opitutales bacterium]
MPIPAPFNGPEAEKSHSASGTHVLAELNGCPEHLLNCPQTLDTELVSAAKGAGATVVSSHFHHFSPHGVSGVVVIAESHITLHTWPEIGYAALDVFTCGHPDLPLRIAQKIEKILGAQTSKIREISRGPNE